MNQLGDEISKCADLQDLEVVNQAWEVVGEISYKVGSWTVRSVEAAKDLYYAIKCMEALFATLVHRWKLGFNFGIVF